MDFEQRYRAVSSRDARFDGTFILGVRSTGIYCRPSCPARTPKPANASFYNTAAAAQAAGLRACKRCLPDAVPGSAEWNLRSDVAARAMRLVADGVVEREGVPGLAARLGYSPRHLNRILLAELGAGPLALARAGRAQLARLLLLDTELPLGEVAFASGFGSVRQFNDTIREVYDRSPGELRSLRRSPAPGEGAGKVLLSLPVRRPYDAAGVFAWLAARAIPGVEDAGAEHYARSLALPGGVATFRVRFDGSLRLEARLATLSDLQPLVARVRRLFDADADPAGVDAALAGEPHLAAAVRATPGIRLPGCVDPAEMLIRAMVGQQISVAAARTHLHRLSVACGTPLPAPDGSLTLLFPTPAQIAAAGRQVLTGPAARVESLLGVATALAAGDLTLDWADDPAEQRSRLLAQRGIGGWTADYVAMRVLGHPDILPTGDVALRAGASRLGVPDVPKGLADWGRTVSPWRSYASLHLWAAAGGGTTPKRKES